MKHLAINNTATIARMVTDAQRTAHRQCDKIFIILTSYGNDHFQYGQIAL